MISWTRGRQEKEVLATGRAPLGDLNHNDSEMVLGILVGLAAVAGVLQVVSFHSGLRGPTVKCVKTTKKNISK